MPIEIVRERLRETFLDGSRQYEFLAQDLARIERDYHSRRGDAARGVRGQARDRGATGGRYRCGLASQHYFLDHRESRRAVRELRAPEDRFAFSELDHRPGEAALNERARRRGQQWGELAYPPTPEARQAGAVCSIADALSPVSRCGLHFPSQIAPGPWVLRHGCLARVRSARGFTSTSNSSQVLGCVLQRPRDASSFGDNGARGRHCAACSANRRLSPSNHASTVTGCNGSPPGRITDSRT